MMQFLFTKTPLSYFVASFWRDEAFSYLMARLPVPSLLWATAHDANPPLYYLLLKGWMSIFGSSEVALRSLSLIFFWATLYVSYLIMREVFKLDTKKSIVYLLIFICNPLLHYYAFEARMYSMMAFLATFLFYALMKKKYKLYAFVALAALFTHYFLAIVIFFQCVYLLLTTKRGDLKHFFLPLLKTGVWYIPWIFVLIFARPPVGGSFWLPPPTLQDVLLIPAIILTGYEKSAWIVAPFLPLLSLFIIALVVGGITRHVALQKKRQLFLLLGWSCGIPLFIFILSFVKPLFLPRYLIFATVGMLLLFIAILESVKKKLLRYALFTLLILFSLWYTVIQVAMRTKAPLKKTFSVIQSEMKSDDVIYVTHEYDFHPAEYYLPTKKVYIYKKTYEEIPWFVGKILMDKTAFKDRAPLYPARAFIINNDGSYTLQSIQ